jgi:hypothetical protein
VRRTSLVPVFSVPIGTEKETRRLDVLDVLDVLGPGRLA